MRRRAEREGEKDDMNLKEKVGQLFMLGFHGTEVSKDLRTLFQHYHPGVVILFSRNLQEPSQAAHLVNALQKLAPAMPLFVAIDQEGGRVARLPKGFTVFPGQGALGRAGTVELAYSFAEVTAKELRAIGVNMNLTPVLDINSNPENPIIGDRAFGNDPLQVETLGLAVIAGLQDNGVLACGKHFPGHGDTTADSHHELPIVPHGLERLREIELRPFVEEAAIRSLQAGADILLICKDQEQQVAGMDAVYQAVKKGEISELQLQHAVLRGLEGKERYVLPYKSADPKSAATRVGTPQHREVAQAIREAAAQPIV